VFTNTLIFSGENRTWRRLEGVRDIALRFDYLSLDCWILERGGRSASCSIGGAIGILKSKISDNISFEKKRNGFEDVLDEKKNLPLGMKANFFCVNGTNEDLLLNCMGLIIFLHFEGLKWWLVSNRSESTQG
jgi:hypothetical protein